MKANPSKFQAICLSRDNINIDFDIGGKLIKSETNVKSLGINKDNKLNFNYHVSVICKKAARQINALQKLCKYMDYTSKLGIYESFISSYFVYCTVEYNTFTVQETWENQWKDNTLLVCNDYESLYSDLFSKTEKIILYVTRKINLGEFVYKTLHSTIWETSQN